VRPPAEQALSRRNDVRIYISADIEGIAGMVSWDEADPAKGGYDEFRVRMTEHVVAACEGALAAGATDILVKDAHWNGRNILADRLPRIARLSRGWSGHPLMMVEGIDGGFDAAMMIGYHSRAGSGGTPQAHTMSSSRIALMEVAGIPVAEFHLFGWAAGMHVSVRRTPSPQGRPLPRECAPSSRVRR
jgi:D-amino peptidase